MYKDLRVFGTKGLKLAKLNELGRVNVICGKNSSGKSTLLNEIFQNNFEIGFRFSDEKIEELYADLCGMEISDLFSNTGGSTEQLEPHLSRVLQEVLSDRVWFLSENEEFIDQFETRFGEIFNLPKMRLIGPDMLFRFNRNFETRKQKFLFLPPKRTIQSVETNIYYKEVGESGESLLNYLFFCKNQSDISKQFDLYRTLKDTFYEITSGYSFDITSDFSSNENPPSNLVRLKFKSSVENIWIDSSDSGLGFRDLLIILFFAIEPTFQFVLVEEPENHIHPEVQRKLLRFLKEETKKQYFISTHSNIFLDPNYVDRVFFTKFEDGEVKVEDATKRTEILNQLGYSIADNLTADLVILTEGPTDIPVIQELIKMKPFELDAKYNIKTWSLGGDNMKHHDVSTFTEVTPAVKLIAIVDSEPDKIKLRREFKENCESHGIDCYKLNRFSTESYFTIRALKTVFNGFNERFGLLETMSDSELKIDEAIGNQLGISDKILKKLNRKIAQEMQMSEIEDTDLYEFLVKVQEKCENS